jgi:hypothetical protein
VGDACGRKSAAALVRSSSQSFDVEPEFSPAGSKVIFARLIEEPGSPFRTAIFVAGADDSRYGN